MHNCVIVGVTGSIAAYKAVDVVSGLIKRGGNVNVIMTSTAQRFINPITFCSISHNRVITDLFIENENYDPNHISLAEKADLVAIVPATANIIGKIASGIADDALTCTVMAARTIPVIIAPAMNDSMYLNPIVQDNIRKLNNLGYTIIEPEEGRLCTGRTGKGRLAPVETIISVIEEVMKKKER